MFTGIIEQTGLILEISAGNFIVENNFQEPLTLGQSIAHDGACMTITDMGNNFQNSGKQRYSFFAMEESFSKTNFGYKKTGDQFNLERCMIYGQRVDGHMVSGHIDTTGHIQSIQHNSDNSRNISLTVGNEWADYCISKGSIAINGVSLTVAGCQLSVVESVAGQPIANNQKLVISICLIPYTREHTNLSTLKIGDAVNIEFDMMGKYIIKNIRNS